MPRPQPPLLELVWPNKDKFLLSPRDDAGKPLWVERTHPAASEVRLVDFTASHGDVRPDEERDADNLLFTGDSLDVLRILAEHPEFKRHYVSQVKCVYIDPPFNTGQAFEHYDDWMEHSTWLSFMRDRLLLINDLLAPDGSVWIHLDDVEQHRMRCLMDEVFGAQNFVCTVVWQKVYTVKNSAKHFSVDHDYILLYTKDAAAWRPNPLPRTASMDAAYRNPDGDPRGPWKATPCHANKPYSKGLYPITTPAGRVIEGPPSGTYWRFSEEKLQELDSDNRVWWGADGKSAPSIKTFLTDVGGKKPQTIWPYDEVGHNQAAKAEIQALFPGTPAFATPKPEALLKRVLEVATQPGDIVLDVFAGSGTTAAAAHKLGRRWVTAEVLAGTVDKFARPRLERVVDGTDPGGITAGLAWAGGQGFRSAEVAGSMYDVAEDGTVLLSSRATNGTFARAMAAQLGFDFDAHGAPFCGRRGRMRLAVFDGAVGPEEVRLLSAALDGTDRMTVVAKVVLPGTEEVLAGLSKGSRVRKAPRDVLAHGMRRSSRRVGVTA